jgi:hypothetical protein
MQWVQLERTPDVAHADVKLIDLRHQLIDFFGDNVASSRLCFQAYSFLCPFCPHDCLLLCITDRGDLRQENTDKSAGNYTTSLCTSSLIQSEPCATAEDIASRTCSSCSIPFLRSAIARNSNKKAPNHFMVYVS